MAKAEASTPLVLAPKGSDSFLKKHLINPCEAGLIWILCKALKPESNPSVEEMKDFSLKFRIHAIYKAGKPGAKPSASVQPLDAKIEGRAVTVWNLEIMGGADSEEMLKGTSAAVAKFVWKTLYGKEGGSPQQQIKNRAEKAVYAYLRVHPEFRENLLTLIKPAKAASKGASTVTLRILGGEYAETSYRILKDDQKSYFGLVAFSIVANGSLYIEDSKKQMKVPENTSLVALKTLFENFVPEAVSFSSEASSEDSDSDESFEPEFTSEALAATA